MDEGRKVITMENNAFPNFDLLDSEIYNEFSYPLLVPSQPPDIRNWFSSYESQQSIDSSKGEHFLRSQELSESETQDPFEDSRKRKLQQVCLSQEKEQTDISKETFARDDPLISSLEIFRKKNTNTDSVVAKKKQSLRHILGDEFLTNCQNFIMNQSTLPENEERCSRSNKHEEPKNHMSEKKTCKEQLGKKCQELSSTNFERKKEDHVHYTKEKPIQSTLPGIEERCPRSNKHEETNNHMSEKKTCKEQLGNKCQELSSTNSEQKKEDHVHHSEEKPIQSTLPENEERCPRSNKHEEPNNHMSEKKTCKEQLGKKCQELSSPNSEQKKEDHVHHTEENPNKNNGKAGFISHKCRPNLNGNREKENKNTGNFGKGGQDPGVCRTSLTEKTNHEDKVRDCGFRGPLVNKTDISVDAVPAEDLSSGKWQCPRKKKPYIGPPLKQLGLQQWIRRVS